jgi:hypothetical protein
MAETKDAGSNPVLTTNNLKTMKFVQLTTEDNTPIHINVDHITHIFSVNYDGITYTEVGCLSFENNGILVKESASDVLLMIRMGV